MSTFGFVESIERLSRIRHNANSFRSAFADCADLFHKLEEQAFASGGVATGSAWIPAKIATVRRKERMMRAGKKINGRPVVSTDTLRATDRLRLSLASRTKDSINQISRFEARFGTRVPYGGFHHTGTRRMPKRDPISTTPAQRRAYAGILRKHLLNV